MWSMLYPHFLIKQKVPMPLAACLLMRDLPVLRLPVPSLVHFLERGDIWVSIPNKAIWSKVMYEWM